MDTTRKAEDPLVRVDELLAEIEAVDPADSIRPMTEIAELLERALGDGDDA
jgi:hypothetical protein